MPNGAEPHESRHLQHAYPDFAAGRKGEWLLRRFKVRIHAVNSTVIQLMTNSQIKRRTRVIASFPTSLGYCA